MAMSIPDLAGKIQEAIDAKDKDNLPVQVTPEMEGYAKAVINTLTATTVSFLPGTVTGTAGPAPGTPVPDLAASGGTFLPPLPSLASIWAAEIGGSSPTSNPAILLLEATASTTYLQTGLIEFAIGKMTGTSTAVGPPTPAPGKLAAGQGSKGLITGLDGAAWSKAVAAINPGSDPLQAEKIYTAIADYLTENLEVTFAAETVNGVFPAISAPMTGGLAVGGLIL